MFSHKHPIRTILISGALLCTAIFAACGRQYAYSGNTYPDSETPADSVQFIDASASEQSKNDTVQEATGMSYNAFLYNSNLGLGDAIGINDFGFEVSKHNDNADRRLQNGPYENTEIHLSEEHLSDFINSVKKEDIIYQYEAIYDVENAAEKINYYRSQIDNQPNLYAHLICDINEIPTEELLVRKISANSSEYLETHKNYYEISSDYTILVARYIIDVLNTCHDDLDDMTLRKIYCMLSDVKVVGIDSTDFTKNDLKTVYNAAVMDDGAVVLDTAEIEKLRQDNSLEKTVYHEIIHLFQRQAPAAKIDGLTQIGSSQYVEAFDETGEINSLHFLWLYEASAEYISMQMTASPKPLVYKNMVGYLNTLNIITLIRPGYEAESIAISQMATNPDILFDIMGAGTSEEKTELIDMLYSICCISNDREDFTSAYDKIYGSGSYTANSDTVKNEMRTSIAKTMTKYFYQNLAERVAHTDVTLEDAFYLINVFEGALSRHLWYDDSSLYSMFEDTLRYYVDTQDTFFAYIAEDSGFTPEQVIDRFNSFAMVYSDAGTYHRNCSFTWLDEDEKNYLGNVFTNNLNDFTVNIRHIVR